MGVRLIQLHTIHEWRLKCGEGMIEGSVRSVGVRLTQLHTPHEWRLKCGKSIIEGSAQSMRHYFH